MPDLANTSGHEPLRQLWGICHKGRRLLDRKALCIGTAVLALIARRSLNSGLTHCLLDNGLLPRGGTGRVFVQEVTTFLQLLPVDLRAELQMFNRSTLLCCYNYRAPDLVIDPLPCAEGCAHGRADE